jgi:hypothetical protein
MTGLFPNLERNLLDKGVHKIDLLANARYLLKIGLILVCTRLLAQDNFWSYTIRNEILTHYTSIEILEDTRVTGLVAGENKKEDEVNHHRRIVGVTTVFQNAQRNIYGQLIVDASGRNGETSIWLEKSGFERPPETKVNSYIGYATRQFRQFS